MVVGLFERVCGIESEPRGSENPKSAAKTVDSRDSQATTTASVLSPYPLPPFGYYLEQRHMMIRYAAALSLL